MQVVKTFIFQANAVRNMSAATAGEWVVSQSDRWSAGGEWRGGKTGALRVCSDEPVVGER